MFTAFDSQGFLHQHRNFYFFLPNNFLIILKTKQYNMGLWDVIGQEPQSFNISVPFRKIFGVIMMC